MEWSKKTPLEWQTYNNKEVKVTADEKNEYQGWVLTTDPVSANIVLANFVEDGKVAIRVIMGHAVQHVEILKEGDEAQKEKLANLFMPHESKTYSQEYVDRRKDSLKTWLEENHIPVTEKGETGRTLCVAGVLTIEPPYGPENCNSSNEIILSRLQGLIQSHLART
ncbi:gem-associated protein 6 isoform X2 [Ambystoma mexicanum]